MPPPVLANQFPVWAGQVEDRELGGCPPTNLLMIRDEFRPDFAASSVAVHCRFQACREG
jgi:hypothetical protein